MVSKPRRLSSAQLKSLAKAGQTGSKSIGSAAQKLQTASKKKTSTKTSPIKKTTSKFGGFATKQAQQAALNAAVLDVQQRFPDAVAKATGKSVTQVRNATIQGKSVVTNKKIRSTPTPSKPQPKSTPFGGFSSRAEQQAALDAAIADVRKRFPDAVAKAEGKTPSSNLKTQTKVSADGRVISGQRDLAGEQAAKIKETAPPTPAAFLTPSIDDQPITEVPVDRFVTGNKFFRDGQEIKPNTPEGLAINIQLIEQRNAEIANLQQQRRTEELRGLDLGRDFLLSPQGKNISVKPGGEITVEQKAEGPTGQDILQASGGVGGFLDNISPKVKQPKFTFGRSVVTPEGDIGVRIAPSFLQESPENQEAFIRNTGYTFVVSKGEGQPAEPAGIIDSGPVPTSGTASDLADFGISPDVNPRPDADVELGKDVTSQGTLGLIGTLRPGDQDQSQIIDSVASNVGKPVANPFLAKADSFLGSIFASGALRGLEPQNIRGFVESETEQFEGEDLRSRLGQLFITGPTEQFKSGIGGIFNLGVQAREFVDPGAITGEQVKIKDTAFDEIVFSPVATVIGQTGATVGIGDAERLPVERFQEGPLKGFPIIFGGAEGTFGGTLKSQVEAGVQKFLENPYKGTGSIIFGIGELAIPGSGVAKGGVVATSKVGTKLGGKLKAAGAKLDSDIDPTAGPGLTGKQGSNIFTTSQDISKSTSKTKPGGADDVAEKVKIDADTVKGQTEFLDPVSKQKVGTVDNINTKASKLHEIADTENFPTTLAEIKSAGVNIGKESAGPLGGVGDVLTEKVFKIFTLGKKKLVDRPKEVGEGFEQLQPTAADLVKSKGVSDSLGPLQGFKELTKSTKGKSGIDDVFEAGTDADFKGPFSGFFGIGKKEGVRPRLEKAAEPPPKKPKTPKKKEQRPKDPEEEFRQFTEAADEGGVTAKGAGGASTKLVSKADDALDPSLGKQVDEFAGTGKPKGPKTAKKGKEKKKRGVATLGGLAGVGAGAGLASTLFDLGEKQGLIPTAGIGEQTGQAEDEQEGLAFQDDLTFQLGNIEEEDVIPGLTQTPGITEVPVQDQPPFTPTIQTPRIDQPQPPRQPPILLFPPFNPPPLVPGQPPSGRLRFPSGGSENLFEGRPQQRFFRVFEVARTPFGETDRPVGTQAVNINPIFEVEQVLGRRDRRRRGPPIQEAFFDIDPNFGF